MKIKLNLRPRFNEFEGQIRQEEYLALRAGEAVEIADDVGRILIDKNLVTEITEVNNG